MSDYIRIDKVAERSFSFAFGDEIRQSIVRPWRLFLLPFLIPLRFVRLYREQSKKNDINNVECLFLFDLEKMRKGDQSAFIPDALGYSNNVVSIGIGSPSIDVKLDHLIPSRTEWDLEKSVWNSSVEKMLLGFIQAYMPKKLIFVGKYPYAAIMGTIRRCESFENIFWVSVRGEEATIGERSERFSKVKELSTFIQYETLIRNTIYFQDESMVKQLGIDENMREMGVNVIKNIEHAEYLYITDNRIEIMSNLLKNQTVFYPEDVRFTVKNNKYPPYVISNLIQLDKGCEVSTIRRVINYRKNKQINSSPVMSLQAKLDVWTNSNMLD